MIIHVITGLNVGGAEQALKRLLLASTEYPQQTVVISLTGVGAIGAELRSCGIEVYPLGMKSALSMPITLFRLVELIRMLNPDIVQTWLYHADLIGGLAAKVAGVKHIIWGVRTTELKQGAYVTFAIRKVLAWLSYVIPSKIVCVAEASKQKHIEIGYCPSKMLVIGNGFDLEQLQSNSEQRNLLRNSCGFSDEHLVVGSVGRFSQDKGQDIFIQAAALLVERFTNVRFLMVGSQLQQDNTKLMSWLNSAGVTERFVLLGERNDIPNCLAAIDIFCLPSRTEGFPNVLGEAMAMALPCVSTDVGDAAFLLGNTGILAAKNNSEDLANSIAVLLSYSQKERDYIGSMAQKRITAEFTQENTNQQYQYLYESMLNGVMS
ncbi:hypothetical protein BCD66_14525 [Pseudoalteromonas tetraodonis]|nr:hypothetical protein BCD66_14525 [Pseudoalteromonas tetraodonis]